MIFIRKRECVLTLLAALVALAPAVAAEHQYAVAIDESLQVLEVTARFAMPVSRLAARGRDAPRYLRHFESCDGETFTPRGRRVYASGEGFGCITYSVDLRRAAKSDRRNDSLNADNLLVSPSLWLWRPPGSQNHEIVVRFRAPAGIHVSAPWARLDAAGTLYRLRRSPESASAAVAFGRFRETVRSIPGANLRIALMEPRRGRAPDALFDWAAAQARNVSLAYGWFPNPEPHVVVIPVGGGRHGSATAVPFGRVIRDGGESVELFVNQHAPREQLYDDWTATHEFSHFMLPYVSWRQRWISEGFAQYYQNVLLARSGQYEVKRAWQKLYEGFERGRRARPELTPNEAAEQRPRGATMKIYWTGAALALEADVELRRRSGGALSLDALLERLAACCLPSARTWRGRELFTKLDEFAGEPVLVPLYDKYANVAGFPDYTGTFAKLGIEIRDGRVTLDDGAPLAAVRKSIMSGNSGTEPQNGHRPVADGGL